MTSSTVAPASETPVPGRGTRLILVKKVLADGQACRKCLQIEQRLREQGHAERVHQVLIADERDPDSPGQRLAQRLGVTHAPFFVLETAQGERVYTSYLKLVREVFHDKPSTAEEARELLEQNPGLDHI